MFNQNCSFEDHGAEHFGWRHHAGFGGPGGGRGRGPWGGPGGGGRGFGGGRERLFDSGELPLVILHLLAEKPSYGYEIIKAIETRLSGGYAPSPGVIYPTLTLLEEEGYATVTSSEGGKKVYAVTTEGKEFLESNKRKVDEIFARLKQAGTTFKRGRSPEIMRAFMNLRDAVKTRVSRGSLSAEQIKSIAEAIDLAARTIDEK